MEYNIHLGFFRIQNMEIPMGVFIAAESSALKKFFKKFNIPYDDSKGEESLKGSFEKIVDIPHLEQTIKRILVSLIEHFQGFPSSSDKASLLYIILSSKIEYSMHTFNKVFRGVGIHLFYEIFYPEKENELIHTLEHEFLHFISEVHENETELIDTLERDIKRVQKAIKLSEEKFNILLNDIFKNIFSFAASLKALDYNESKMLYNACINAFVAVQTRFFRRINKFWNLVSDMALHIIAIELSLDNQYIDALNNSSKEISELEILLKNIFELKTFIQRLIHTNDNRVPQELLPNLLASLFFVEFCIITPKLPSELFPYAILGKNWKRGQPAVPDGVAQKNLDTYLRITKNYCEKHVYGLFMEYYQSLAKIVDFHAIHNYIDESINTQIHNTETIKRARRAYRILIHNSKELYKKLN